MYKYMSPVDRVVPQGHFFQGALIPTFVMDFVCLFLQIIVGMRATRPTQGILCK